MSTNTPTTQFGRRLASAVALTCGLVLLGLAGCNGSNGSTGTADGTSAGDAQPQTPAAGTTNQFGEPQTTVPTGPPSISFDALSHDFGAIAETDTMTTAFTFKNAGGATLVLEEVKPTCGCTVVSVPQMSLAPGQTGRIDVRFTPTSAGDYDKIIYVASNDPTKPRVSLSVKADVEAFITVEPEKVNFQMIIPGNSRREYVSILSPDPELRIVEVSADDPAVDVRIVHASSDDAAAPAPGLPGQGMIEVTASERAPWGPLFSWVSVTVEGTPPGKTTRQRYTRKFRVQGQVFGDLMAEPDTFRAGADPGESFTRTIRLTRLSGQPFRITEARITNVQSPATLARATVQTNEISESAYDLVLNAAAGQQPGSFSAEVHLTTTVPGLENIVINVSGRVFGPAG